MTKFDIDLDDLRAELDEYAVVQPKRATFTPREERIIAGFEDIVRFYDEHKRLPQHGEGKDIFERLYAVRLDRLRELEECRSLLAPFDTHGLITMGGEAEQFEDLDDDALLAELKGIGEGDDITKLKHVMSREERRAAEEIAHRERCADFDRFEPLFKRVQAELDSGTRTTRPFVKDAGFLKADISKGQFFILGGQVAYIASVGDAIKAPNGETDARLRVIYSNGTESNLLLRSFQRALYKDDAGRRISEPAAGPLFADAAEECDVVDGAIYVLRSLSAHPFVEQHRNVIHKIGVTAGSPEARVRGADKSSTYLFADIELVATYKVIGVRPRQLEALLHRVFSSAQLDLTIEDRFGVPVKPKEWFLVPLHVIDEAVSKIRDGSIVNYQYVPADGALKFQND